MKKAYLQLMEEHKLAITDLPKDCQIAIKSIKDCEAAINMQDKKAEKAGKTYTPSADVLDKIKALDKWIVRDIIDFVNEKDTNTDAPPIDPKTIVAEIKADVPVVIEADPKGVQCDVEFAAMLKAGKTDCTADELKTLCPTAEKIIWEDTTSPKGLTTSFYIITETEPNKFTLKKI